MEDLIPPHNLIALQLQIKMDLEYDKLPKWLYDLALASQSLPTLDLYFIKLLRTIAKLNSMMNRWA